MKAYVFIVVFTALFSVQTLTRFTSVKAERGNSAFQQTRLSTPYFNLNQGYIQSNHDLLMDQQQQQQKHKSRFSVGSAFNKFSKIRKTEAQPQPSQHTQHSASTRSTQEQQQQQQHLKYVVPHSCSEAAVSRFSIRRSAAEHRCQREFQAKIKELHKLNNQLHSDEQQQVDTETMNELIETQAKRPIQQIVQQPQSTFQLLQRLEHQLQETLSEQQLQHTMQRQPANDKQSMLREAAALLLSLKVLPQQLVKQNLASVRSESVKLEHSIRKAKSEFESKLNLLKLYHQVLQTHVNWRTALCNRIREHPIQEPLRQYIKQLNEWRNLLIGTQQQLTRVEQEKENQFQGKLYWQRMMQQNPFNYCFRALQQAFQTFNDNTQQFIKTLRDVEQREYNFFTAYAHTRLDKIKHVSLEQVIELNRKLSRTEVTASFKELQRQASLFSPHVLASIEQQHEATQVALSHGKYPLYNDFPLWFRHNAELHNFVMKGNYLRLWRIGN